MKTVNLIFFILSYCITAYPQHRKYSFQQPKMGSLFNIVMYSGDSLGAARAAGAASASWDVDFKILSVSYSAATSPVSKIEKSVAAAGHDTNNEIASGKAYQALSQCCKYERKTLTEKNNN